MSWRKRRTNISARTCAAAAGASLCSSSSVLQLGQQRAARAAPPASSRACDCGAVAGLVERLAPGHLLHQELARHGRVALGIDRRAAQLAQVGRALQRLLQALVGLVDAHRPLHGDALRRGTLGGEAVRVHLGLQLAPALRRAAARSSAKRSGRPNSVKSSSSMLHQPSAFRRTATGRCPGSRRRPRGAGSRSARTGAPPAPASPPVSSSASPMPCVAQRLLQPCQQRARRCRCPRAAGSTIHALDLAVGSSVGGGLAGHAPEGAGADARGCRRVRPGSSPAAPAARPRRGCGCASGAYSAAR